ncbi:hypothetical protein V3C99_002086, partial [Haemonchus contortus]
WPNCPPARKSNAHQIVASRGQLAHIRCTFWATSVLMGPLLWQHSCKGAPRCTTTYAGWCSVPKYDLYVTLTWKLVQPGALSSERGVFPLFCQSAMKVM